MTYRELTLEQRVQKLENHNEQNNLEVFKKDIQKSIKKRDSLWQRGLNLVFIPFERLFSADIFSIGSSFLIINFVCACIYLMSLIPPRITRDAEAETLRVEQMQSACQTMNMTYMPGEAQPNVYDDTIICAGPTGIAHINTENGEFTRFIENPAYHE